MRKYILTSEQSAANCGFTDLIVIPYTDWAGKTASFDTALLTLDKGDVVYDQTTLCIKTAFAGTITGNTMTAAVGRTASAYADFLAAITLSTTGTWDATVDTANYTVAAGAGIAHQPIAADSTIVYLRLAITAGSTSLTGLTAGEMQIWLKICRSSGRNRILA